MTTNKTIPAGPNLRPPPSWCSPTARCCEGYGLGATGHAVGEVCFNTAMTGYEEILTDPSYAGQIITFTFPHIGNVGTNEEDIETVNMAATPGARGVILRTAITEPSNYRATAASRCVAQAPRHRRALRHRHARADQPDPHQGHAERRDRACARRQVRSRRAEEGSARMARPRRHGPRADGDERRSASPGTRPSGSGRGLRPPGRTARSMSSRSTTASSATSCACSPAPPAR